MRCIFVIFAVLLAVCYARTTPPHFTTSRCLHNGKTYQVGSFQPSPCEHCQCTSTGRAFCAIADCFITPCVDSIHDPTKCCPVCPNGPNCRAPDGTIIKKGEKHTTADGSLCQCQTSFSFSHEAICLLKPKDPILIDPVNVPVVSK
ncbi:hypothetical protein FSP39_023368 [Pinctada imbricata]|uniref:VWFC domain-containing protein n=1 Tax=Pinctada imbricata TaxID=66713 RepID=A0AA89BVD7_PINIB|nr:hypothetical protein FSP39_023368 [Pinctada imbricata]